MRWIALAACVLALGLASCQAPGPAAGPEAEPAPPETAVAPPAETPPVEEAEAPAPAPLPGAPVLSEAPFTEGPLLAEVVAMQQVRTAYFDAPERGAAESNFAMRVRIRGEQIKHVAKHGNLILTELVDDTGNSMIDDQLYTDDVKTMMRRMTTPEQRLGEFGLFVASRARPAGHGATKLARVRGEVRLVLASETRKLTIADPLQFYGKVITDPQLSELGMLIRVVPADECEEPLPEQCIALEFQTKEDHVVGVEFFDGQMKRLLKRERPYKTKTGATISGYCFQNASFDNEMQLVIEVYPTVEEIVVPLTAENIPLP